MKNHPFHLVENSPWPLTASMGIMTSTSGTVLWFHNNQSLLMNLGALIIILTMIQWWRDVIRESTFQGIHTKQVIKSMKWGMMLFILSEVLFFSSFFWAFFHSSLTPTIELGMQWPPAGIKSFNPMGIPLLNTLILLSSGISITWAHNAIINNNFSQTKQSLWITILMGIYFTMLQAIEYLEAPFSMADSIYGSTFFMSTGFHGLHVIIGTIFITISTIRTLKLHMSMQHHVGFETSAWYWHFVDVVWLFLYTSMYWWGK
uniref:cytochrome c oxidase subunit III n=1 Tax=Nesophrosyne sp. 302 GMB-2012 TaxID=1223987 RepID=UPI0021823312|nr:cytochrome c oxidase subunit III [Nesophrosyne sp. 302 GMB-2012]UVI59667.1 cytochrome c oxidase subunit III [Nesophrosyne sp. 302 GMB-2012]